jgi:hypothetical protein
MILTKKLQLHKKVAIAQKSCNCAKKLQLRKKVCRFLRRNSTCIQKVAIAQKSCNCTKKLQMRKKVAIAQKSCNCAKKLQLREKVAIAFVRPNQLPPINSPENSINLSYKKSTITSRIP